MFDSPTLKQTRERQLQELRLVKSTTQDSWKQMMVEVNEIFTRNRQRTLDMYKQFKVQERLIAVKKSGSMKVAKAMHVVKLKIQEQDLNKFKERWEVVRSSEVFTKIFRLPLVIKDKVIHYYEVFMNSKLKCRIQRVIIFVWNHGKAVAMRIHQFIYEAYFETKFKAPPIGKKH